MSVVVVGGGLAGGAAACLLARAGRPVRLIERSREASDKICGEFVSGEAQRYLASVGLDLASLGAVPITHVRLLQGAAAATCRLPFPGLSLTRRALDEALLRLAAEGGADVTRGCTARRIDCDGALTLALDSGETVRGSEIFLATGKHVLRGAARGGDDNDLIGFKSYFRLAAAECQALAGHTELILYPGGYAGLQPVEGGAANLCLLVSKETFARAGRSWDGLLDHLAAASPHLGKRLTGAAELLPQPLTIAQLPYGFVHRPSASDPARLYRLGDQAAITEPFSGDGMSLALHSAHLAVVTYLAEDSAYDYHRRLAADVAPQIRRARWLAAMARTALGRAALIGAAQALPGLLGIAARWTRLSDSAQRRLLRAPVDLGAAAV